MRPIQLYPTSKRFTPAGRDGVVTIVTRTKDRPVLLVRAFCSILSQTYQNWRLYLVNDGGDQSVVDKLIDEYKPAFGDRITVMHNARSVGREASLNCAMARTVGEYVAVHDDSESWHPSFLERTVRYLSDPNHSRFVAVATMSDIVCEQITEDEIVEVSRQLFESHQPSVDLLDQLARDRLLPICLLTRRSAAEAIGYYNVSLPGVSSWDYNVRLFAVGDIGAIDEILAYHHDRVAPTTAYSDLNVSGSDGCALYETLYRNSLLRVLFQHEPGFIGLAHAFLKRLDRLDGKLAGKGEEIRRELCETRRALVVSNDRVGVYFRVGGNQFSEERSVQFAHPWDDDERVSDIVLPIGGQGHYLRIDPSTRSGVFVLEGLWIDGQAVSDIAERVASVNGILVPVPTGIAGAICIYSGDRDPYVELDVRDLRLGRKGREGTRVRLKFKRVSADQITAGMLLTARDRLAATERELEQMRVQAAAAERELEQTRVQAAAAEQRLAQWRVDASAAQAELNAIRASTLGRAMSVLRNGATHLPVPVRVGLRRIARAGWWVVTPWRVPVRLRIRRERREVRRGRQEAIRPGGNDPIHLDDTPPHQYVYVERECDSEVVAENVQRMSYRPTFSVIVPVYNTDPALLREMIASVEAQWYPNWELILVDDHSSSAPVGEVLDNISDPRVTTIRLSENRRISGATNAGLSRATGDYIVFLDHDDELTPDCLYELALCIDREHPDYVYSDEDKLDVDGTFRDPFFKPDWSPDTMMSIMLTCHVSCVRRSLANAVGGLRSAYDGSQDWDFVLRASERAKRIAHIPKVLYHWRITLASCASDLQAKPYAADASKRAREDALRRRGLSGEMVPVPGLPGYFRTCYHLQGQPLFSIIIPTKDNGAVLQTCIDSILAKTRYRSFEVIVVNNGSTDEATLDYLASLRAPDQLTVLDYDAPFNYSKINNYAVQHSHGNILVFLNDDTEVLSEDWLDYMGGYAQLSHVGAVGAKLLYPGGKLVQHVGVLNLAPGPAHAYAQFPAHAPGYFMRNMLEYDWIAVTGACMMLERRKYDACGGFDEDLAVAYNDTALCFSLAEHGLYQVVCPGIELIHHESLTRGDDTADPVRRRRLDHERELAFQKHPAFQAHDPFYNPNLDPNDAHFGLRFGSDTFERVNPAKITLTHRAPDGRCALDLIDRTILGGVSPGVRRACVTFAGWATDGGSAPAGDFALVLSGGGGTYCAWTHTGTARLDVAAAKHSARLATCGFRCTLSLEQVAPGTYSVYVISLRAPGASCRIAQGFVVG